MKVLIFGYSDNPERYSHMACLLLKEYQHEVITLNLRNEEDFQKLNEEFHTVTMYVNPSLSDKYQDLLLNLNVKRVIFNPGTENSHLESKFSQKGIEVLHACTLVMLKTQQFN
jgi:predicted CoA-binding protein